jgi:carboxyl-terminal processing protease
MPRWLACVKGVIAHAVLFALVFCGFGHSEKHLSMKLLTVVLFVTAWIAGMASAADLPVSWMPVRQDQNYRIQGSGDPRGDQGATVTISFSGKESGQFGGAEITLDAAPFRGHTVTLQADLTAHDVNGSGLIWMKVMGPNGLIDHANTGDFPVSGNATGLSRFRRLDIPASATQLVLGVTLAGQGAVTAERLKIVVGPATAPRPVVSAQTELDAAIRIVRQFALRANDVDWSVVEPQIRAMAANAKVASDVYPAIRALLKALNDHHSFLLEHSAGEAFNKEGGGDADPVVSLQGNGVGYVMMPGYNGTDPQAARAFASGVASRIYKTASQAQCGWIVDLRNDHGGNMYPMLEALTPLLGSPPWGSFRDVYGRMTPWSVSLNFYTERWVNPDLSVAPVAVLLGPHTASSGEVVAIAFQGRANTRSFGASTAGLTTANRTFPLPDGSLILLAAAVDVDRNNREYGSKIDPDQPVSAQATNGSDPALDAAKAWLSKQSSCAP